MYERSVPADVPDFDDTVFRAGDDKVARVMPDARGNGDFHVCAMRKCPCAVPELEVPDLHCAIVGRRR